MLRLRCDYGIVFTDYSRRYRRDAPLCIFTNCLDGSTITSQLAMTLGGSLFPGALGSMLIEILPFLRGIASSIQQKLGDDSPSLIPTVMAAYAMTSFLTGFVFIALGALGCGRLVSRLCLSNRDLDLDHLR